MAWIITFSEKNLYASCYLKHSIVLVIFCRTYLIENSLTKTSECFWAFKFEQFLSFFQATQNFHPTLSKEWYSWCWYNCVLSPVSDLLSSACWYSISCQSQAKNHHVPWSQCILSFSKTNLEIFSWILKHLASRIPLGIVEGQRWCIGIQFPQSTLISWMA